MNAVFCIFLVHYYLFSFYSPINAKFTTSTATTTSSGIQFNIMRRHNARKLKLSHETNSEGSETSIIHGNSTSINYYFITAYFGTPPQKQALIIDTGSSLTGVPCEKLCKKCGKHLNQYFNPFNSYSNTPISCTDDICLKTLTNKYCNENLNCVYNIVIN